MHIIDITLGTTYATTAAIALPGGMPPIAYVPTTGHYLQGVGGFKDMTLVAYAADHVHFDKAAVAYNVVKLKYRSVGELVRT